MELKLRYYGDPILRQQGEPIAEITDEIRDLANSMLGKLEEWGGWGLAAQQVGYSLRLFVMQVSLFMPDGSVRHPGTPYVCINPKIVDPGDDLWVEEEGCLSFPGLRVPVERPHDVTLEYTDLEGERHSVRLEYYEARCAAHENDHTNGVLHIDRVARRLRQRYKASLQKIKKKYHGR